MGRKLSLLFAAAAICSVAQETRPRVKLWISLDDHGRQHAWLFAYPPLPESVTEAFRQAMGCPQSQSADVERMRAEVNCAAPIDRNGLEWSVRWDLAALNAALTEAGASSIQVQITEPPFGFALVTPALEERHGPLTFSQQGVVRVGDAREISLRTGFSQQQVMILAVAAGIMPLIPLVLFAFRRGGLVAVHAASNAVFCFTATAWLILLFKIKVPYMAVFLAAGVGGPVFVWQWIIVAGPAIAAVFLASLVIGGTRRKIVLWKGIRAIAMLSVTTAFFVAPSSIGPWGATGLALVVGSSLMLRHGARNRVEPVADGELINRARAIAARAGTTVKGVYLIVGGTELPAAFATRFHTILLSRGILRAFPKREVDAIMAHELSHVARHGTQRAGLVGIVLPIAISVTFFAPEATPWMPLLLPVGYLVYLAVRRSLEWTADADAVAWSGDGEALITGLARVSRAHSMALDWPRWAKPLMQHPSTIDRIRAIARQAGVTSERLAELLALAEAPTDDTYPISGTTAPSGMVFGTARRAAVSRQVVLVGFGVPILFAVLSEFIGALWAIAAGVVAVYLLTEWTMARARWRGRKAMAGRPGVFSGFSPSTEPRMYDGSYEYDWGFAAFEGDKLQFRGDRSTWAVGRGDIARIWIGRGPSSWTPKPVVCCVLKSGAAFSLRPFDGAFGPAAASAAKRLHRSFESWLAGAGTSIVSESQAFDFAAVPSQPVPPFTLAQAAKAGQFVGVFALASSWAPQLFRESFSADPLRLFAPVLVAWAVLLFTVSPGFRRNLKPPPLPGPPLPAQAPGQHQ